MKEKSFLFLVLIIITATPVSAPASSIYEYLQKVDNFHIIVLGLNSKGGITLAAIDVATGLRRHNPNKPILESVIENSVNPNRNKILIGHPCNNSLVPLSCKNWPYKKGEGIIKVVGNDLIVSGTEVDDIRKAAKIIMNYKNYPVLKTSMSVIIAGSSMIPTPQNIVKERSRAELVCGDLVCEAGESGYCFIDCAKITCFDICNQEGFGNAACRDKKSNPNVPSCLPEELSKGGGYCATEKVCCCEKEKILPRTGSEEKGEETHEKELPPPEPGPLHGLLVTTITVTFLIIVSYFLLKKKS